jgi:hypothetical protein
MRVILQRWPVLTITQIQISPNVFPRQYTTLPNNMYDVEYPVIGLYGTNAPSAAGEGGQSIIISSGYADWSLGRWGFVFRVQYINGWPHTSLTAPATNGATTIFVDDCTGWGPFAASGVGATGTIYDSGQQEVISVTGASVVAGPGTLTLASGLQYTHSGGTLLTTLPYSVVWAVILLGTSQALTRGATSTTVHAVPGGPGTAGGGPRGPEDLTGEAELLLHPYRRVI